MSKKFSIAALCGGPSLERGISLNSCRSLLDHLSCETIEIVPFYFDQKKRAYKISPGQLYSNTPSDFDFKLRQTAQRISRSQLVAELRKTSLVFPVIHGALGEDGEIQRFLEKHCIPFIGSSAASCRIAFDKSAVATTLKASGEFVLPSLELNSTDTSIIKNFWHKHRLSKAVVKPASSGSSIGVGVVLSVKEAVDQVNYLLHTLKFSKVILEPFAKGTEFTVVVVTDHSGMPLSLIPTEVAINYQQREIFDYRKKYLPTQQVDYHCPPRFSQSITTTIQRKAEHLFETLHMRDFARFDGWVLDNGEIWFSDVNPISGMEQNSFLFQQGSRVGFTHRQLLHYIVQSAATRYGINLPETPKTKHRLVRTPVRVLFGGSSSERQVSLMSGTNVWLKLRDSAVYDPRPFLLEHTGKVWKLPYAYTLNHTVDEIVRHCKAAHRIYPRWRRLAHSVRNRLPRSLVKTLLPLDLPKSVTLKTFLRSKNFIFLALHGGIGEDGTLQRLFEQRKIPFNGSTSPTSQLCMNKYLTNQKIREANLQGVVVARATVVHVTSQLYGQYLQVWQTLQKQLKSKTVIVKPVGDGCSSGIARLFTAKDFRVYLDYVRNRTPRIPPGTLTGQSGIIEMPSSPMHSLLVEEFIETDKMITKGSSLQIHHKSGWVEVTVGVLQNGKKLHAFNPSLTIAEGQVLSLEEKFQGGTGVNITPPPASILGVRQRAIVRKRIEQVAALVGISGYCRIDAFVHRKTGRVMIIEVNTLPGLTPSTVIYHQGLAETPSIFPRQLLERLVRQGETR